MMPQTKTIQPIVILLIVLSQVLAFSTITQQSDFIPDKLEISPSPEFVFQDLVLPCLRLSRSFDRTLLPDEISIVWQTTFRISNNNGQPYEFRFNKPEVPIFINQRVLRI